MTKKGLQAAFFGQRPDTCVFQFSVSHFWKPQELCSVGRLGKCSVQLNPFSLVRLAIRETGLSLTSLAVQTLKCCEKFMTIISEPFRPSHAMLLGRGRAGGTRVNSREKCGPRKGLYMTAPLYLLVTQERRPDMVVLTDPCDGIINNNAHQFLLSLDLDWNLPLHLNPDSPLTLKRQWIS